MNIDIDIQSKEDTELTIKIGKCNKVLRITSIVEELYNKIKGSVFEE